MGLASFGVTGACRLAADGIAGLVASHAPGLRRLSLASPFLWLVMLATAAGVALSFTPARALESAGASRLGSYLLYLLISTVGMQLDVGAVWRNPAVFAVGFVWIAVHVAVLAAAARLLRAPFFFVAVGSMANVGGAATAPIVAAAFDPALAPVGVLLSVLGYTVGTYMAWATGLMLRSVAEG